MSTFVSNHDQNQVTEAIKAPFRLKSMNDATKNGMQGAIEAWHESARFDHDDDNVTYGNGDMVFDFIDGDGNIENPSTDPTRTVKHSAHKSAGSVEHEATNGKSNDDNNANDCMPGSDLNVGEKNVPANDNKFVTGAFVSVSKEPTDIITADNCPDHKNSGMKTSVRPDGIRYAVGGKGPLMPAHFNIDDAEDSDGDPVNENQDHRMYGGKGPVKTTHLGIENAEMSEKDTVNSDEASDDASDEASEDDAEVNIVHSSISRRDIGMKSCIKPDGTRYTVGGKGLIKATDSNNDISEPSVEASEDSFDSNSPTRSATGLKSCTKPDGTRYTVGSKGPIRATPSHIVDAEVSEEDSDESEHDPDSEWGEQQEFVRGVREDIEEKLGAIADLNEQVAAQQNVILKKRMQGKLNSLEDEMRVKLASLEDSEATEMESVDDASQHHTKGRKGPNTQEIDNINAASDDNEYWPGENVSVKKYIKQKLRSTSKKTLARITALDAVIEWYTREKYQTLDASRWGDLKGKIAEHREELAKLLQSIGIDENRPQDEAWGWAIRLNEHIRKKWQDCNQIDPLAKHNVMEEIDEMNEQRRMKLEAISKEDCRVTLLGWVNLNDRKPLSDEASSTDEASSQQQFTVPVSSQQACQSSVPILDSDVAMIEATDASSQSNGNNEQATLTAAEDATAGTHNDAVDVEDDLFGDDLDFTATFVASNASEPLLENVLASSQNLDEAVESSHASLPSAEAVIVTEPQAITIDDNTDHIDAEALSTVPAVTSEVNGNLDIHMLGSVPTSFSDDFGVTQSRQVAEVIDTGLSVLTEAEEALFEELIDVSLLEQDVQQDKVPSQQEPMLAPVDGVTYQAVDVPQDVPVIASQDMQQDQVFAHQEPMIAPVGNSIYQAAAVVQDGAVASQATEAFSTGKDFRSSAEWNERPEIPTLDEFLQFMDETTKQQLRAYAWSMIQEFVRLETFHSAQLDVFAFAPTEVQEPMLAEYEKCHREGGQFTLPLAQSHSNDPELPARTPICICFSNFVVQMYPATETEPEENVDEQAQPAVQNTVNTSGSFDLDSFDFGTYESSGPIELEDIVNAFADVNGDQTNSSIENVQETVERSVVSGVTSQSSQHQNYLQAPAPNIVEEPAQVSNGAATKKAARGKKSAPTKRKAATAKKAATPKRKGPDLPLQPPVDESTFGQLAQGDVVECPVTPAQKVGGGLDDWGSKWCRRSWSEEQPEPKDRTPAELARLQQLSMNSNQGMHITSLNPSPDTSSSLVTAINVHLSQAAPSDTDAHASTDVPAPVEQQTPAKPVKRSHPGRPAAPVTLLKKNRTRKLKHPESPQKAPSGKYTRRKSKLSSSAKSDSSVPPQQAEDASGPPTTYYEAAPNRRLGLDTSAEDWVAQSTNKRKRAQPAKKTPRKMQKTQQPTPASLQSSQADHASALDGNSRYRAILPRPKLVQAPYDGMQTPDMAADNPGYNYDSMSAPEPMMLAYASPIQQAAEPDMSPLMGMPPNVPVHASQQSSQQMPGDNMMLQQDFQRSMASSTGVGFNGGLKGINQSMQQPMQNAGLDGMDDFDDDSDDEIMRRLRQTERKMKRQEEALRRIAEMEEKMRHNEIALASRSRKGQMMNGGDKSSPDSVDLTQLDASSYRAGGYQS